MFQTKVLKKINTRHFTSINFFQQVLPFKRQCGKNGRARYVKDDNKAHALCMLDKATHTLRICNTCSLLHDNNGYANAPRCYVYTYIACLVYLTSFYSGTLLIRTIKQITQVVF